MPLKSSSKTGSRRSSAAAAALLLLAVSPPLFAQRVDLRALVRGGIICADVDFRWDREQEFLNAVRDGLESRITFTARLYERRAAFLPFFRNVLVESRTFSQSAFFDFLGNKYVVETDQGRRVVYDTEEELIRGFFSMPDITLAEISTVSDPYVTARVQFEPVRLMPPLTIVSLVGAAGTYTSPWVGKDVAQ